MTIMHAFRLYFFIRKVKIKSAASLNVEIPTVTKNSRSVSPKVCAKKTGRSLSTSFHLSLSQQVEKKVICICAVSKTKYAVKE